MNAWLLLFLFFTWCFMLLPAASNARVPAIELGRPKDDPAGVSILPGIPFIPLVFWGLAWLIDRAAAPWGTYGIAGFHLALLLYAPVSIYRDTRCLRAMGFFDDD